MQYMKSFYERLSEHMQSLDPPLDFKELHYLSRIAQSQFHYWKRLERLPSDNEIERLASVKELGIPWERLIAWRVAQETPPEAIRIAVQLVQQEGDQ